MSVLGVSVKKVSSECQTLKPIPTLPSLLILKDPPCQRANKECPCLILLIPSLLLTKQLNKFFLTMLAPFQVINHLLSLVGCQGSSKPRSRLQPCLMRSLF